jgi:plastocyanin
LENAVQLHHAIVSLAAAAAVASPIAGCGSSSASSNASHSGAQSQFGGPSQSKSGASNGVSIANFKFVPASLTVKLGTKVTVTNNDSTAHTFTADNGDSFDTGHIDPTASMTVVLSEAGTFKYHCSIHPFMHGTLVVK